MKAEEIRKQVSEQKNELSKGDGSSRDHGAIAAAWNQAEALWEIAAQLAEANEKK